MSKDPTRNIDRYKIRGGQMNAFEFHQNQGAVSEQRQDHGDWAGAPEDQMELPPDKAKAERVRQLLIKHGESVPQADGVSTEEEPMEKHNREKAGRDSENDNEAEENFAPTHGRSPEVIKEMIQSRRATDKVSDPEDIEAGRENQSEGKKERGETGRQTSSRRTNKQTARPTQTVRSQYQKTAQGKEAALDKSKAGTTKGTSSKKEGKPSTTRKSAKQTSAATATQQASKKAAATRSTKSTKKAATASSGKKDAMRSSNATASARTSRSTGSKTTSPREKPSGKGTATARRTAKPKRAKTTGKSR